MNIGPTVGVNIPIGDALMLTFSSGYTWRGAYRTEASLLDPTIPEQATTLVEPARVATQSASLGYQLEKLTLLASASYAHESTTYLDHVASYELGDRYTLFGVAGYAWTPSSSTTFTASWTNAEKNRVLDQVLLALIPESFRSNSAVYRYRLEQTFTNGSWTVAPMVNYMRRDQNSYNPITLQFIPAKTRIGTGGSAQYAIGEGMSLKASVEHFWINEDPTARAPDNRTLGVDSDAWRECEILTRTIIRLSDLTLVAAFVGGLSMSAQALAQTACPEGRTAGDACVNGGLAKSMRNRSLIFTQPKLSYTGPPASQSRGESQDTVTPRLIEGAYDKYGPPPPQPVPAVIGGFPLPGGFP